MDGRSKIGVLGAMGIALVLAVACSNRQVSEDYAIDQERIDNYCNAACQRSTDCGMLPPPDSYDACFADCTTGEYMRWPDDDCQEAMWSFYDCRLEEATSCEDWGVLEETRPCWSQWGAYSGACYDWIIKG